MLFERKRLQYKCDNYKFFIHNKICLVHFVSIGFQQIIVFKVLGLKKITLSKKMYIEIHNVLHISNKSHVSPT